MICKNPYIKDPISNEIKKCLSQDAKMAATPFGCGQCLPCRINQARTWQYRLMLELRMSDDACFVTLTFNDENLPKDQSLNIHDLQLYIKRVRKNVYPKTIRYFAVGEYGSQSLRPHFHLAIFGLGLNDELVLREAWNDQGFVDVGELNKNSARYITGYVTAKLKKDRVPDHLKPEFSTQSRNPPIGGDAIEKIAKMYREACLTPEPQQVTYLTEGKRDFPLGRTLINHFNRFSGLSEGQKAKEFNDYHKELSKEFDGTNFLKEFKKKNALKIQNMEWRHNNFKRRRRLD